MSRRFRLAVVFGVALSSTCTEQTEVTATREELLDPKSCEECHPKHFREWSGSMHAYASDDPYFRAMNRWGQEATAGALGDLCVRCHAPMAVEEGLTHDGLNLDDVPQHLHGVTCYYCHTVDAVEGLHNNQIVRSDGINMLGSLDDAVSTPAHESGYAVLLDGQQLESSKMCGSCHDVITPAGVALERAYAEWAGSLYAHENPSQTGPALYSQRCNSCHMPGHDGAIADAEGARPDRRRHDHSMPGPGVVVTAFPDHAEAPQIVAENLASMEAFRRAAICASLCVKATPSAQPEDGESVEITVWLHNETSGHAWPSGAAQDRRAWIDLLALSGAATVFESGRLDPTQAVATYEDPNLWWFGDRTFDAAGQPAHGHWEITSYEAGSLPVAASFGGDALTWIPKTYAYSGAAPDRVELRMFLRPMPRDLLDDLVHRGYLDAAAAAAMPTFEIAGAHLDWTTGTGATASDGSTCVSSSPSCRAPILWEVGR